MRQICYSCVQYTRGLATSLAIRTHNGRVIHTRCCFRSILYVVRMRYLLWFYLFGIGPYLKKVQKAFAVHTVELWASAIAGRENPDSSAFHRIKQQINFSTLLQMASFYVMWGNVCLA